MAETRPQRRPPIFFAFTEDARWNGERQAVEFGVEIGEYSGVVRVRGACSSAFCPSAPPPSDASRLTTYSGPG